MMATIMYVISDIAVAETIVSAWPKSSVAPINEMTTVYLGK
jgi:hypothetical protein